MFRYSPFSKTRKRLFVAVAGSLFIFMLAFIPFSGCTQSNSEDAAKEASVATTADVNPDTLPELSDISLIEQPVLYDFVDGSLGLHESFISLMDSTAYVVILVKDDSSVLHVAMHYGHQSDNQLKNLLPIFSSAPMEVELNDEKMKSFKNGIEALVDAGDVASLTEGDNTFYAVPYAVAFLGDTPLDDTIDLKSLIGRYTPGKLSSRIYDGMGIPTEIIRAECDLQAIEEVSGLDFNDPFWDNVNYESRVKVHKANDQSEYCIISPIFKKLVAGYGEPLNMFTVNGMDLMMAVGALDQYLIENGYESIEQALASQDYASKEEYDARYGASI